jgi:hypothetical protein
MCAQFYAIKKGGRMVNWEVNFKNIAVKMSDGKVHTGKVNIRDFQRLSDFLKNKVDDFIVIVSDDANSDCEALMLNKRYIIEAMEAVKKETIRSDDTSVVNIWDASTIERTVMTLG